GTVRIRSEPHAQSELEAPAWSRHASRIAEIRVDFRRRRNEVVEAAEVAVVRRVEDLADDADVHETPDQEILLQPEIPRLIRRVEREAAFLLPFVQPSTVFVRTETLGVLVDRFRDPRAERDERREADFPRQADDPGNDEPVSLVVRRGMPRIVLDLTEALGSEAVEAERVVAGLVRLGVGVRDGCTPPRRRRERLGRGPA